MASRDPFSSLPDIAAYQPRPATERALGLLAEAVHLADRPVVLEGPPGIGKTLLLHLLAHRLDGQLRAVAVPIPTLSADELWHWVAASLGLPSGGDSLAALAESHRSGAPVLLLIDDANSLPPATLEVLSAELSAQLPGLRAVLVASDDEDEGIAFFEALGEPIHRIRFDEPMSAEETSAYVCTRLAGAQADAKTVARFDDAMLARLHAHAKGVPAAVHEIADLLVRPDEAARAHELAAELRPEIVSNAAARRSRESIDRISEWGDEDLAKTVARRGSHGAGAALTSDASSRDTPGLFAPDDGEEEMQEVAAELEAESVVADVVAEPEPPVVVAPPVEVAPLVEPAPSAEVASPIAPKPSPVPRAPRPRSAGVPAPAVPATASSPVALRIAAIAAAFVGIAAVAAWQFEVFAPPKPTHVATFIEPGAAPPVPAVSAAPPARVGVDPVVVAKPEIAEPTPATPEPQTAFAEPKPAVVVEEEADVAPAAASAASAAPTVPVTASAPTPATLAAPVAETPAPAVSEAAAVSGPPAPPKPVTRSVTQPAVESARAAAPATPRRVSKPLVAAVAGQRPPSNIAVAPSDIPSHLASVVAPAGTRVEIGDSARGTAPLAAVFLSEGEHRVRWTLATGETGERVFEVDAEHRVLDISAAIAPGVPPVSSR